MMMRMDRSMMIVVHTDSPPADVSPTHVSH